LTAVGGGFLVGHAALAVMLPLAAAALAWSFRRHHRPLPLVLGALAALIGYLHILAGTPEWTVYGVLVLSLAAAILDWRASRAPAPRRLPALGLAPGTQA
jgi:DMSO/TMAO reductase YedYZ heme-binding membrane subunit